MLFKYRISVENESSYERYSRQIVLDYIGIDGQNKLQESTALIAGVGGLGSFSAMELARMGVKSLILVDRDIVSYSDLHRQVLYDEKDVGLPKVEAAKRKLASINSNVKVEVYGSSVNYRELMDQLVKRSDVVIDGLDNMSSRYTLNSLSIKNKKPYIFAAAIELYGNVSTIIPGNTPCLEEFYGSLNDSELPKCATSGVHPSIVYIVSSLSTNEAVSLLIGRTPNLASKLALVDLRTSSIQSINLKKNNSCPVCTQGKFFERKEEEIEISCSKDGYATLFINKPSDLDIIKSEVSLISNGFKITDRGAYYITFKKGNAWGTIFNTGYMVYQSTSYHQGIEEEAMKVHELSTGK